MTGKIDFGGKKVLITGASTGIGKALAHEFAGRGAHLAMGCLPQEASLLNDVAKDIRETFPVDTWCFPLDLAAPEGPESLYKVVKQEAGDIDILVNNAGTAVYGNFWEQPPRPAETDRRFEPQCPGPADAPFPAGHDRPEKGRYIKHFHFFPGTVYSF